LHGGAAARATRMGVRSSLLTLTHSEALAMAQVLLLGD
jgi:phosphopantetheinyl transferase (holo-ACP synthase)